MKNWKHRISTLLSVLVTLSLISGVTFATPVSISDRATIHSARVAAAAAPSVPEPVSPEAVPAMPLIQSTSVTTSTVYLPLVTRGHTPPPPTEAIIQPGVGGQVGSPDGKVRVVFAPKAVTQTVIARYAPITPPSLPLNNWGVGGPAFRLIAQEAGTEIPVTEFPPITQTITYEANPSVIVQDTLVTPTVKMAVRYTSEGIWGLDEHSLAIYTRPDSTEPWQRISTAIYPERNTLVAELTHLSEFVVMGELAAQATKDRVCLDPDHGPGDSSQGHALWNGVTYWEAPLNYEIAEMVKERLESRCDLPTVMTRGADEFPSRDHRIDVAIGFGSDVMTLIAFNALYGTPWGVETDGGPLTYARPGNPLDDNLGTNINTQVYDYTGRQTTRGVLPWLRYPAYNRLPNDVAYSHAEVLFMDHNYDHEVIADPAGKEAIADALYYAIIQQLGLDDDTCELPPPPSAENIKRWRDLGYQNYQRYGGDPVSFSTGNHVVQVRLFRIPGRGDLDFDFTLTYNSQDGRDSAFGYSWAMPYDVRITLYRDDSVDVRHADGRTHHYTWNGSDYDTPTGIYDTLIQTADGWQLTTPNETVFIFEEIERGVGRLVELWDRKGNTLTFGYDGSGEMTSVSDSADRAVSLHYTNGHVTQINDFDGRSFSFQYDGDGNLVAITDANGGTRRFGYDARHRMTHEWDEEDILYLQSIYDDRDRVIEQIDASGSHSTLAYDPIDRATTFTDNLGNQEVYHWDELNRITGEQDGSGGQVANEYDADYNLISRTDANGNTTRYEYDARGNVVARHDPLDQYSLYGSDVTRWAYNERNLVTSTTDALGHTWTYEYDSEGNLIHTLAPDGAHTRAEYNDWGQPTRITDADGHETRYEYDQYGNRIRTVDHDGYLTESEYDAAGREVRYTDANGHSVTFEYDGNDNIVRITDPRGNASTFEYDGNDLLVRSVDRAGGERVYEYDENLKLTGERDPEGNWTRYGYDAMYNRVSMTDALGHETRYAYDDAYRLEAVTDPTGAATGYEYDANGNTTAIVDALGHRTRMVYDASNRLKFPIDAAGHRTEYCYDAEDRLIRTIGPRGEVTDYTYDPLGRLVSVKDPLGNVTGYEYDAVGKRLAEIDPLDHRTDYAYDALDRLTAIQRPELPGGERPTTQFAYDAVGNTLVITGPRGFATTYAYDENDNVVTITDPLGGQTAYTYDAEDRPVTATDANGHTTTTTYNGIGLVAQIQAPLGYTTTLQYDAAYNLVQRVNAMHKATGYAYDPAGRLIRETDPLGNATEYARDALGRVTAVTDANGHTTGYDYDALGRLIAVTDALDGVTAYTHDAAGNLTTIADANGHVTAFDYNFLNQLIQETNPLSDTWRYSYDGAGRLIRRVDAIWQATYYDNDSNDRLTAVRYGTLPPTQSPVTFTYDLEGNETQMCDGLSTLSGGKGGCTSHTYDPLGRRTATTDWLSRTITRTYDAVGNLAGMVYPNGRVVTYTYGANDWLTAFTDPHGGSSTFDHNPLGQVTRVEHPNDTAATFTYDDAGRLTGIDHRALGATRPQSAYAYAMDKVGNRTQVVETRAAFDGSPMTVVLTHTYEYDALDRLMRAATDAPPSDTAYTFDAVGNRLTRSGTALAPDPSVPELPVAPHPEVTGYTYNAANQLLTAGDTTFDYNANGDRISETEILTGTVTRLTGYAYDREDRLVGVTTSLSDTASITVTMVATYTYDGYGRRVLKAVTYPGGITLTQVITYLYDGLDIVGAQLAVSGTVTETYYYLTPSPVTGLRRPLEMERLSNPTTGFPGDRHWYQADGLDSVVSLTEAGGDLASPDLYDEYGQMLAGTTELQLFAYTGQDYDLETGLYHFYARYYDSAQGIWLTQDLYRGRLAVPTTLHRYIYLYNSSTNSVDILGYAPEESSLYQVNRLKEGDILLFHSSWYRRRSRPYMIDLITGLQGYRHAAIYIGNGKMAHYPAGGESFKIESIESISKSEVPQRVDVYRYREEGLDPIQRSRLFSFIEEQRKLGYSFRSAILSVPGLEGFFKLGGGALLGMMWAYTTPKRSCAAFVNATYEYMGLDFTPGWMGEHVSPNDLYLALGDGRYKGTLDWETVRRRRYPFGLIPDSFYCSTHSDWRCEQFWGKYNGLYGSVTREHMWLQSPRSRNGKAR